MTYLLKAVIIWASLLFLAGVATVLNLWFGPLAFVAVFGSLGFVLLTTGVLKFLDRPKKVTGVIKD